MKRGSLPQKGRDLHVQPHPRSHVSASQTERPSDRYAARRHGRATRRVARKDGTKASRTEYARVIGEWETSGRTLLGAGTIADLTVAELLLGYWRFAEGYYVKNGRPTKQLGRIQQALKPVRELYGRTSAREFGPLALETVRGWMLKQDWSRRYVNACVGCVTRAFKWGVAKQLIPPSVYHGLQAVEGLKKGRTTARDGPPVRPANDSVANATLPYLLPQVRAMIQVQRLTGMRPGEVVIMRPRDVDRSAGKTWLYRPDSHKTEHHGIERAIFLGPQAQEVLAPYLLGRDQDAYLFSPREAMWRWRAEQREQRKSKVQPSQQDRRRRTPRKGPGDRYHVGSYGQAILRACKAAFPPPAHLQPQRGEGRRKFLARLTAAESAEMRAWWKAHRWHPNQLRHSLATEVRREAGLDAARAVLGHRSPTVTEVYAELDIGKAAEVLEKLG